MKIELLDAAILLAYLAAVVVFGVWIGGRRQQGSADFMVGGRSLPWWLLLFSIVATETSTVTFLSIPGFAWAYDMSWLQLAFGFMLARFLITWLLLPRYFEGELFTAYEVLHKRFGGAVKRVASALFVVTRTGADGLRLFLSAIVLQEVTGVSMTTAVVCLGVATILYTVIGGMRAVVWTDFIQFAVYMAGAAIAFAIMVRGIDGGLSGMLERAGAAGKLTVFQLGPTDAGAGWLHWLRTDVTSLWAGLLGGTVLTLGTHGVDQMFVQRYLCASSRRQAGVALSLSGLVVVAQFAFFLLIGAGLFVFHEQHPPAVALTPSDSDRVFASFIVDEMPAGVLGIVLGAVFSAAMSTLSSSLNSSATAVVNDLHAPLLAAADDRRRLRLARIWTVVFGIAQIGVGIGGRYLEQTVVEGVLGIAGFTTGLILGVFVLGMYTRRVGSRAALVGLLAGLLLMLYVYFAELAAWPWYTLIGSSATVVAGLAASVLLPGEPAARPPNPTSP